MAIALPSLIGGVLAELSGAALFGYVALNTGLALWSKHRNKKKEQPGETPPSTIADTENALGQSMQVVFGMANLGGQVFDVINRADGGYPVFGSIGYVFPKDFSVGVDLVARETGFVYEAKTGEDADDKLLTSYSKITRDSDSGSAVSDQTEIRKSVKFGNDARKTVNNVFLKFFNKGGFSQNGDVVDVLVDQQSSATTALAPYIPWALNGYGSTGTGVFTKKIIAVSGLASQYQYVLDFSKTIPTYPTRAPSAWDILRLTNSSGQTYLVDIVAAVEITAEQTYTFQTGYPLTTEDDRWVASGAPVPVSNQWMITTNMDLRSWIQLAGAKIEILLIEGSVPRQADTFLQFAYPSYQQNNPFAWLAQEVRDPGNTATNVTTGIVSAAVLVVDEAMPACNTTPITSKGGLAFFQLVAAVHATERHLNPYAMIYELLVNGSFGLGWDPDKLDIDSFVDCFDRCMANDPNIGNERAWKFGGYVMSDQKPAKDYIEDILNHVHGDFVWTKEGKLKVFLWDGTVPANPKRINMRNVLRESGDGKDGLGELLFKINTSDTNDLFNELNVRFFRPDKEFVPDYYLRITDYADTYFSGCVKPKNMDLLGFYEPRYARKSGLIHMARNQKENEFYETEVDMAAQDIEAGDIVLIEAFDSTSDNANAQTQYLAVNATTTWSSDLVLLFDLNEEFLQRETLQVQDLLYGSTNVDYVTFTGTNTAVIYTTDNPITLGAAVGDLFSLYDTDSLESKKYVITALTISSISINLRPIEVRPGDRAVGDKITFGAETLLIEDTGFDSDGNFYIRLAGDFASSPVGQKVTLKRLAGIKMLDSDRYARVVEVKSARDMKTSLTLQLYDVTAYGGANVVDYTITAPTYVKQNFLDEVPPKPEFVSFSVDVTAGPGGTAPYVASVSVRSLPDPRVDRVVVTLYASDKLSGDLGQVVGTKTLEHGGGYFQLPLTNARMFQSTSAAERLIFKATAIAYNRNNLASDTAYSSDDLGSDTVLEEPVVYPADVAFDTSRSFYRNTLLVVSKKYNDPTCSGLELRKTDANWGVVQGDVTDTNLLARGSQQIVYEQTENLPTDTREFTVYLKAHNPVGLYSANAASLTLTDYSPAAISVDKVAAAEMGPVVKLTVSGFDDGVGGAGTLYPLDVRTYKFYISSDDITYTFAGESSRPEYLHTLASADFGASDTVTRYFKCVAWDRLTTEAEDADKQASVAGKSVTFRKLNTVDMQLDAFLNELTDNLFRLDDWGYTGISTEAKIDLAGGESYAQVRGLEAGKTYTVAWDVVSGSPTLAVTGSISPTVTLDGTTLSAKFTLPGTDEDVTFTITSVSAASVRRMRLTEGNLAKNYTLHPDDRPIQGRAKTALDYVTSQVLETLDSMNVLLGDVDQLKTDIIQKSDEIRLRVVGKDILTQIILNEQGIYFGGRDLVFDGNAVFLNTAGVVWGKITNISGSTIQFNIGPCQLPTVATTFRQDFSGTQGEPQATFTISTLSRDPDTGVFTATVSSGTPQLGMFIDQNITTTTIDGGKITTESIVASKIAAGTIGANKLIAREIQANFLQFVGSNNIVISASEGILIFATSAVTSGHSATAVSVTEIALPSGHSAVTDDYIKFEDGNNQGVVRKLTISGNTATFDAVAVMFDPTAVTCTLYKKTGVAYMQINISSGKPTIFMVNASATTKISTDGVEIGAGKLDIGSGGSSLHFDTEGNLWLGASTFASAPFRVSKTGEMTAETGTFKGALNIGSGSFVVDASGNVTAASLTLTQVVEMIDRISAGAEDSGAVYSDSGTDMSQIDWTGGPSVIIPLALPSRISPLEYVATIQPYAAGGRAAGYGDSTNKDYFILPEGEVFTTGSLIKGYQMQYSGMPFVARYKGSVSLTGGVGGTTVYFTDSTPSGAQIERVATSEPVFNALFPTYLNSTYWELPMAEYCRELMLSLSIWADGGDYTGSTAKEVEVRLYFKIWQQKKDWSSGFNNPLYEFYSSTSTLSDIFTPGRRRSWLNEIIYAKEDAKITDLTLIPFDEPFVVTVTLQARAKESGVRQCEGQLSVLGSLEFLSATSRI